jgi:hypothetical protein
MYSLVTEEQLRKAGIHETTQTFQDETLRPIEKFDKKHLFKGTSKTVRMIVGADGQVLAWLNRNRPQMDYSDNADVLFQMFYTAWLKRVCPNLILTVYRLTAAQQDKIGHKKVIYLADKCDPMPLDDKTLPSILTSISLLNENGFCMLDAKPNNFGLMNDSVLSLDTGMDGTYPIPEDLKRLFYVSSVIILVLYTLNFVKEIPQDVVIQGLFGITLEEIRQCLAYDFLKEKERIIEHIVQQFTANGDFPIPLSLLNSLSLRSEKHKISQTRRNARRQSQSVSLQLGASRRLSKTQSNSKRRRSNILNQRRHTKKEMNVIKEDVSFSGGNGKLARWRNIRSKSRSFRNNHGVNWDITQYNYGRLRKYIDETIHLPPIFFAHYNKGTGDRPMTPLEIFTMLYSIRTLPRQSHMDEP